MNYSSNGRDRWIGPGRCVVIVRERQRPKWGERLGWTEGEREWEEERQLFTNYQIPGPFVEY